ncbi:UNVERIFIED_ORG: hypothetical protein J2791_001760 [Burkholderia contaminans]|nr:hypothetical protein [Burkholderia contaminans]
MAAWVAPAGRVVDGRRRVGAQAASSRAFAAGLPTAVDAFLFGDAAGGGPVFFTGVPRNDVFFAAASPSAFARFASGAAWFDCVDFDACLPFAGFAVSTVFTVFAAVAGPATFPAFAFFPATGSVLAALAASSRSFARPFFRPRAIAFGPAASLRSSSAATAGNTDSSVRKPAANSRFFAGVSRFTQYSARDALDRSGRGNAASTARGLRERV